VLADVAKNANDSGVYMGAMARISDQNVLADIAKNGKDPSVVWEGRSGQFPCPLSRSDREHHLTPRCGKQVHAPLRTPRVAVATVATLEERQVVDTARRLGHLRGEP